MSAGEGGGRYAFLTTPRWVRMVATLVTVSVACALLGAWQWTRYEDRAAAARQVAAAYDAEPVPVAHLLDPAEPVVTPATQWRPVTLTGRYLTGADVLLRNRPVEGTAAVHVVAPFLTEVDGREVVVVVDRGWLPAERAESGPVPAAPDGEVRLTARLRVAEPPQRRSPPPGQVYSLDTGQVLTAAAELTDTSAVTGATPLDGYVAAVAEDAPGTNPAGADRPTLGELPRPDSRHAINMSYALQWWFFAVAALGAIVLLARREAAENAGEVRPRRVRAAEAEEDALVDAQLSPHRPDHPAASRADGTEGDGAGGQASVTSSR